MPNRAIIAVATAWGPKHGGINAFNYDFVRALGVASHRELTVVCAVPSATPAEVEEAARSFVSLRAFGTEFGSEALGADAAAAILESVRDISDHELVWLGHDIFTGAAAADAAARTRSRVALVNHMSYVAYKAYQTGSARAAQAKSQHQRTVFERGHCLFSMGPLLRDELADLLGGREPHVIVPGFPELDPAQPPRRWTMLLFGRLDPETDRIKQGRLGIAAFAQAHRDAVSNAGLSAELRAPRLKLFGIDPSDEADLRAFAEREAGGVVDFHPMPFETDRSRLFRELAQSSVAVMPSWHEGFGLVGWEAIGAGVPLVLSERSGLHQFLDETLAGAGIGCVHPVRIRGSEAPDAPYRPEDVAEVADALKRVAGNPDRALKSARLLRELLSENTWASCARRFLDDIGWRALTAAGPTSESLPAVARIDLAASTTSAGSEILMMPRPVWRAGHGHPDSLLLRADEECVPFDLGRADILDDLLTWARRTDGFPVMVRLHTGPGGSGKTRLLLEACRNLGPEWNAGFLDGDCPVAEIQSRFSRLLSERRPTFVVVDYAETRRDELAALAKVALSVEQPRVRIVLLARDAGEWWESVANDYPACERLFAGPAKTGPFPLPALHPKLADRDSAFIAALHALAARLGISDVEPLARARPDLSAEHFGAPLYVQMAALLALRGERSVSAAGLTEGLLRHEERYWSRLPVVHAVPAGGRAAAHLLAVATMCNGIGSAREAVGLYEATEGPICSRAELTALFRALAALYPGRLGLQPMRPDVLGEALVSRALGLAGESRDTILRVILGPQSSEPVRRHALTVMTRLARQRPDFRPVLLAAVRENFVPCLSSIVEVSLQSGEPLPETAVEAFETLPYNTQSQASGLLRGRIPHRSLRLAELALRFSEFRLSAARSAYGRRRKEPTAAELARALALASLRLENVGKFAEALELAQDARIHFEQLTHSRRGRYEPELAGALNNLGNLMEESGRVEEALALVRTAHRIYSELAKTAPEKYESDLALTLCNLSGFLATVGADDEALETALASHTIRKRLATAQPGRFEHELAETLGRLANRVSDGGRFEDALARAREAHAIYARLAQARPDRFDEDLAHSLATLSRRVADLGRFGDALGPLREAHAILARLSRTRPTRFAFDLLSTELQLALLTWIEGAPEVGLLSTWAEREQGAELRPHRGAVLRTSHAVVLGCISHQLSREDALARMRQAVAPRESPPAHFIRHVEEEHLVALAYLARYAPGPDRTAAYARSWHAFRRRPRVPATLTAVLERLGCPFPPAE
jgi:glycosyltransferase involved in cell wall biosynthesis/tetratricopeptide (TPR) repeat protein